MQITNTISNLCIYYASIHRNITDTPFTWYKYNGADTDEESLVDEHSLTKIEASQLLDWFNKYPLIFSNNLIQPYQAIPFNMPNLNQVLNQTPQLPKIIIKSTRLRNRLYQQKPNIIYDLEFDVIGYEN